MSFKMNRLCFSRKVSSFNTFPDKTEQLFAASQTTQTDLELVVSDVLPDLSVDVITMHFRDADDRRQRRRQLVQPSAEPEFPSGHVLLLFQHIS